MKIDLLGAIITISGLVFFSVSLTIVILGRRVGDRVTGLQKIKLGKSVEIAANSVLTLVLITACFSLAPLALTYWKPELSSYVERNEVDKNYLPLKDMSISILGAVVLEGGSLADNVKIEIRNGPLVIKSAETDEQGFFRIDLPTKLNENYTIVWSRQGYAQKRLSFGFNQIFYPVTLTKEAEN